MASVFARAAGVLLVLAAFVQAASAQVSPAQPPAADRVRIQLKWTHQFQFAGYYLALRSGHFRARGIDAELLVGGPHVNPTQAVLDGRAEFGIATSGLLATRSRGHPVVAVAAIYQHSPYVLISRYEPDLRALADLAGRRVMVEPYAEELLAYLRRRGVDPADLEVVPHTANPLDLAAGRADAMTAYTTTEPFLLNEAAIPYRVFDPKSVGIDFYGDTLFTTEALAARDPDLVERVRLAVVEGWLEALRDPEAAVDVILREYETPLSRDHLLYEAFETRRLTLPEVIEVGYMNPERWTRIADAFRDAGLLESEVDLDRFLFRPPQRIDWTWVYLVVGGVGAAAAGAGGIAWRFHVLNRRLRRKVRENAALHAELERLALTDPGTGLLNRRGFLDAAERELGRADRTGRAPSLLVLDLDRFKAINDRHGHAAGDRALEAFAAACRERLRRVDVLGRLGGEEFAALLPETDLDAALETAQRLRAAVADVRLDGGDAGTLRFTVSIGAAERVAAEDVHALMARADAALYRAKAAGRDRVEAARAAPRGPEDRRAAGE
jgi:diguanylate cyclase (GGDEF)-like protein